ncbi:3-mercaptopyruvate sulfurtransferase [Peptostreptococcus sp. MV1]|uniref:sulfurtransferase n=1 Tax=Peptostreptococcus sp. MV1 TaxID=1219626 RepID=UPI00050E0A0F|nr:sulfurtransferase [Peptostreptococcus sp. MV1]KGF12788.1 3-mercaptopyruvate sulfurtransferase [Peptostreptococcus sp. MV1]
MKRLITVDEFFDLQKSDKKVVVLDCRFDLMNKTYGIDSYKEGHIKDAFLINIEKDLTDPVGQHGGRHPFKDRDQLKEIIESFGIDNDTVVVTYDDGDLQGAGRLVFQLNNLGFYNAFVLDGGLIAYKAHGGQIETEVRKPTKSDKAFDVKIDTSFMVDMEYVKSKLYDENTIIIDSRSHPRYLGLEEPVDKVAGHIPSAKNYFFMDNLNIDDMTNSSYISEDKLKERFKDLDPKKEIIVYCGSGISLMVNALALDKIGIPYKIYPGSYSDWISYDENKIATGQE